MQSAKGTVFKYGDNVDTDVIIPARYLNSSDPAELATHCMEDIDKEFIHKVSRSRSRLPGSAVSLPRLLPEFSTGMPLILGFPSSNARRRHRTLKQGIWWR